MQIGTSSWSSVAAGPFTTLGILSTGALFAWGFNGVGNLGLSVTTNRSSPVQVGTSSWTQV